MRAYNSNNVHINFRRKQTTSCCEVALPINILTTIKIYPESAIYKIIKLLYLYRI